MRSDAPAPSWYEPIDLVDDEDLEPEALSAAEWVAEPLVVSRGWVSWQRTDTDD